MRLTIKERIYLSGAPRPYHLKTFYLSIPFNQIGSLFLLQAKCIYLKPATRVFFQATLLIKVGDLYTLLKKTIRNFLLSCLAILTFSYALETEDHTSCKMQSKHSRSRLFLFSAMENALALLHFT